MKDSDIFRRTLFTLLLTGLLLASCVGASDDTPAASTTSFYSAALPASGKTPVGVTSDAKFIEAATNFSETLFRNCLEAVEPEPGKNLVLSPFSVVCALSMTANGAAGDTLAELNALNSGIDAVQMNEYLYAMTRRMENAENPAVRIANSVWISSSGFSMNREFETIMKNYYNAPTVAVDFSDRDDLAAINRRVSEQTDGMITDVAEEISPTARVLLINAVLFDGAWEEEYEEEAVYREIFTGYDGGAEETEFLHSLENSFFEAAGGVGFSKPYRDGSLFVALLPEENADVYAFASELDIAEVVEAAISGKERALCSIPKFEYETTAELRQILTDMGLETAFSPQTADFSGIGKIENDALYLSSVLQKSKITLNERGTKAAAVTEVFLNRSAARPRKVSLNRPFFYMILDGKTHIPLFMGILANPNG